MDELYTFMHRLVPALVSTEKRSSAMMCSDDVRLSAPCSVHLSSCVLMQTNMTMIWTCLLSFVLTFSMLAQKGNDHDDLNDDCASVCPIFCPLLSIFPDDHHDDDGGENAQFPLPCLLLCMLYDDDEDDDDV